MKDKIIDFFVLFMIILLGFTIINQYFILHSKYCDGKSQYYEVGFGKVLKCRNNKDK